MGCVTTMDKKQLVKLISAFAMADGGLYRRSENGNAYFMMNMLSCHQDYISWVEETLKELTGTTKSEVKNPYKRPQTRLSSKTHPTLTKIHGRIYRDCGYKGLDEHHVKNIDWEMLAIFYMADGSLYWREPKKEGHSPLINIMLNMKRLSYGDQWFLKKSIKDNLGIEFNINKHFSKGKTYYMLRLRNKDAQMFFDGIRPYMVDSFHYKLCESVRKAPVGKKPDDEIV